MLVIIVLHQIYYAVLKGVDIAVTLSL